MLMADTIRNITRDDISVRLKRPTPTPSRTPVPILNWLVLSLRPTFCVNQSTIDGRTKIMDVIRPVWNGRNTLKEDI
jgi:hypothetical protein